MILRRLNPIGGRERRGTVLLLALFVMIPIAALVYATMRMGTSYNRENLGAIEEEQALFIAEAGTEEAILALRDGATGNVGTQADPIFFGGGLFWVTCQQVGSSLFLVQSQAMYGGGRAAIERLIFRRMDDLMGTSIFSNDDLVLQSNVFLDSYDSALGDYGSQVSGGYAAEGAQIESNGDITIESSVEVHGDLYPSSGYAPIVPGSSRVSGVMQGMTEPRTIPKVVTPTGIASAGDRTVSSDVVVPSGKYRFDSLEVDANITLTGPAIVVIDDMVLRSNSSLVMDTSSGPIELYVSGAFKQASNSDIVTTSKSAEDMRLYLTGDSTQSVDFRSNSEFYGVVYAPESTVSISSNFEVFGSVIANSIILDSNARIHFDEQLRSTRIPDAEYVELTWAPVGFPDQLLMNDRSDPFRLLGVDRDVIRLPAEGHL